LTLPGPDAIIAEIEAKLPYSGELVMATGISAAVGPWEDPKVVNNKSDIIKVQKLLESAAKKLGVPSYDPNGVDGQIARAPRSSGTLNAIEAFQKRWTKSPDRRVDKSGTTWKQLVKHGIQSTTVVERSPTNYSEAFRQTPNCKKGGNSLLGVVLHHSAGSYGGSVNWCLNKTAKVSYHCIIDTDGSRTVLAKDNDRCWHAGKSEWNGTKWCNNFTIGLAWSGNTYVRELNYHEIYSAIEYLEPRMRLYGWTLSNITTHRHVSPGRKNDPSPAAEEKFREVLKASLQGVCIPV